MMPADCAVDRIQWARIHSVIISAAVCNQGGNGLGGGRSPGLLTFDFVGILRSLWVDLITMLELADTT